jgi:hypothetical protein
MTEITAELSEGKPVNGHNGSALPQIPRQRSVEDRPAPRDAGIAVLPRRLIGVREEVLDWVPEERPRYTRLGLILINTGLMASISLFTALLRVVQVPWPVVIPVAIFWGFLVLAIDSWMVSSTHGSLGAGRWLMFIPRLIMAILLGSVIAEPLVLWIFHPAINADVEQHRQEQIRVEAGRWARCNPLDGGSTTSVPECANYQLGIGGPGAEQDNLASLQAERDKLSSEVTTLSSQLTAKQDFAQDECAGVKRGGTSGQAGKGFRCDSAWDVAETFEAEIDLPAKRERVSSLNNQINTLTGTVATAEQQHGTTVEQRIDEKVKAFAATFGPIDIIDEARGLERLSDRSGFVAAAEWLVRILLILVDSLPVLAKMLSGTTAYDVLVSRQLHSGQRFHSWSLDEVEHRYEAATKDGIRTVDERSRVAQERHDEDLEDEIDRRAKRYAAEMA